MPPKKTTPAQEPQAEVKLCTALGCGRPVLSSTGGAKGLCGTHYRRLTRANAAGKDVDLTAPVRRVEGSLYDLKIRIPEESMIQVDSIVDERRSTRYRVASDIVTYAAPIRAALRAARKTLPAGLARAQVEVVLRAAFGEE